MAQSKRDLGRYGLVRGMALDREPVGEMPASNSQCGGTQVDAGPRSLRIGRRFVLRQPARKEITPPPRLSPGSRHVQRQPTAEDAPATQGAGADTGGGNQPETKPE